MPRCLARPEHPSQKPVPPPHSHGAPSRCSHHHRPQSSPVRKAKDCRLLFTDGDTTTPRHAERAQGHTKREKRLTSVLPIHPSIHLSTAAHTSTCSFLQRPAWPRGLSKSKLYPRHVGLGITGLYPPDLGLSVITGQGQALGTPSLGCPADYPKP